MVAHAVEVLSVANWQRTKDGQKGRNKPKPLKRPGLAEKAEGVTRYGGKRRGSTKRTTEEVRALLRARGPVRDEPQHHDGEEVSPDG